MTDGTDAGRVALALAQNVRAARAHRGWSLEALASRSGVSKGALVALEAGRGNPGLATLVRLGDALGLPLTRLVEVESDPAVRVTAPGEGSVLWQGERGGWASLLAGTDQPGAVELWRWHLPPGEGRESEAHAPGTRELVLVLAGELVVTSAATTVRVPAGGAARLVGDRPHAYRCADGATAACDLVLVVTVPPVAPE